MTLNFRGLGKSYCPALLCLITLLLLGALALGPQAPVQQMAVSGKNQSVPGQLGAAVVAPDSRAPDSRKVQLAMAQLPLRFEPNQGQADPQVKFMARGAGYGLFLTPDQAVLALHSSAKKASFVHMQLAGANKAASIAGTDKLPGKSNYFIGNDPSKWRQNIPQFAQVEYNNVYRGVDLVYYGDQGQLEYDFRVAPGADTSRIALDFSGASARIVAANGNDSGDLILATANGEMRFHAPRIYQPAAAASGNSSSQAERAITGGFRQLAGNKIGFAIGDYDHSRELVIDPVLSYSTYLGGSASEGGLIGANPENLVKVAVDSGQQIYLAGSTNSAYFFPIPTNPSNPPPIQSKLAGMQNIFIAVLNPNPNLPTNQQLVYATYIGGSLVDSLAGIAVDQNRGIYIAGTTTSPDFPTSASALPQSGPVSGTHGFLSAITLVNNVYTLTYSTYLAGNASDTVTGLAIDQNQNAYVTGVTTSSNAASQQSPFPASPSGYQTVSNSPGNPQFFASKIDTVASGSQSMLYSTYFGGGYPASAIAIGGGIAVDPSGPTPNLYITGTTNMLNSLPSGVTAMPFPLLDAQQSCLNLASRTNCTGQTATTTTDAFIAKIDPNLSSTSSLVYSTYIGAEGNDYGNAIDVDTSGNAYVIGSTNSTLWVSLGSGFQTSLGGGFDAYVVKIGSIVGTTYPITYFTYLGGTGDDFGEDIKVDSIGTIHAVGTTGSSDLLFLNPLQPTAGGSQYNGSHYGGQQDAFVALIGSTLSGRAAGNYLTYLGGSNRDQGTGVALDTFGATYAAGTTISTDFPVTTATSATTAAYQPQLDNGSQDAFVSKIGANSTLVITVPSTSPSPFP
ncbi:MAG: SBBP repeat-containing protein, partial [Terriglobales bacterium]